MRRGHGPITVEIVYESDPAAHLLWAKWLEPQLKARLAAKHGDTGQSPVARLEPSNPPLQREPGLENDGGQL